MNLKRLALYEREVKARESQARSLERIAESMGRIAGGHLYLEAALLNWEGKQLKIQCDANVESI